jgi:PAS domain S-box-containing protein
MSQIIKKSAEQKIAESEVESFRKARGPFVVAAETTRMAMVFTDAKVPDNSIIFANESFLALTGYDREEVLGQSFNFLMARGADQVALAQIARAFDGGADGSAEINYRRKDGSVFCAALLISPVMDESGDVVEHFASFVDLTKQKHEQAQSTMMIDELNHRVKNTLSTVQSIVWQALRKDSEPKTIREAIESRLFALSRSHDLLSRENWKGAGLQDLVEAALEPFGVANGGRSERFVITGKNIRLPANEALALGIAFHELATNAVKYGAFSSAAGSIALAWTIEPTPDGDRLILRWQEKDGPSITAPTRKGFGSRVLERGLPHELGGSAQLDYQAEGLICTINIPGPPVEGGCDG